MTKSNQRANRLYGLFSPSKGERRGRCPKIGLKKLVLCVFFIATITSIVAPQGVRAAVTKYDVNLYGNANGIPTGEANAVIQDPDGYIWVGGYGGLFKYDGITFEKISVTGSGLISFSVRSLWIGNDNCLWVGTNEQGAFYYSGGYFYKPAANHDNKFLSVRCFAEDAYGRVWLGTADGLAYIKDHTTYAFDLSGFGVDNSTIYSLSMDKDGLLWAVDYSGSLLAVDTNNNTLAFCFHPGDLWDNQLSAYTAMVSREGTLFVGTNASTILQITKKQTAGGSEEFECNSIDGKSVKAVNSIYQAENGDVWFAADQGIGVITGGVFSDLSYLDYTEHLVCVIEDYEHNIWAASSKHGLVNIQHAKIARLITTPGLQNSEAYTVFPYQSNWYIGSESGLTVLNSDFESVSSTIADSLAGVNVHKICADADGKLYIGTYYHGLYIYDTVTNNVKNVAINGSKVRDLQLLSPGKIAVATNHGVDFISDGEVTDSVPTNIMVLCLCPLDDGRLLCGTDGDGILAIQDKQLTVYAKSQEDLSGGVILRIEKDTLDPEKLWVSCGGELFYGNDEGFQPTAVLRDGAGSFVDIYANGSDIWLFRSSGIIRVEKDTLLKTGATPITAEYYSKSAGLPGSIVANSFSWFGDKVFAICTTNGIGLLEMDSLHANEIAPKIDISAIYFDDKTVWDGTNFLDVGKNCSKITIKIASLSFFGDGSIAEYWLEGFDKGPIVRPIAEQNEISYTNLSAGTYTFHFRAKNGDDIYSDELTLTLVKAPKFKETIWFRLLLAGGSLLICSVIVLAVLKASKKKQRLYKEITDETISTITRVIDAKDPYTQGHSRRVADFSVKIGKKLGLKKSELESLYYTALLHDIGKIGVPDQILKKNGKLTDEEYQEMKRHTDVGGNILSTLTVLKGVWEGALYHHERYDGKGYLHGLKGSEIPLFARIICVADSYDAMSSTRCYRSACSKEKIIAEITNGRDTQFDGKIADIALEILSQEEN